MESNRTCAEAIGNRQSALAIGTAPADMTPARPCARALSTSGCGRVLAAVAKRWRGRWSECTCAVAKRSLWRKAGHVTSEACAKRNSSTTQLFRGLRRHVQLVQPGPESADSKSREHCVARSYREGRRRAHDNALTRAKGLCALLNVPPIMCLCPHEHDACADTACVMQSRW